MYRIKKGGAILSTEDGAVYVRLQENGVYITCPEHEAQGIVVNGGNIYALNGRGGLPGLEAVTVEEFSGAALIAEAHSELDGLIAAARQSLISPPSQGAPWNAETRYITGDTVEGYIALKYSRNKPPAANLGTYWAVQTVTYPAWGDIEDGTVIEVDTIVTYNGKTWKCTEQHIKSTVYKPKAGSTKWSEYTE